MREPSAASCTIWPAAIGDADHRSGSASTTAQTRCCTGVRRRDAIVSLSTDRVAERELRSFRSETARSGFLSGKHAYRLSPNGLDVFRAWPIGPTSTATTTGTNECPPECPPSTQCFVMATTEAPRPCSPDHQALEDPARTALRLRGARCGETGSLPRSRRTRYSSNGSSRDSPGRCTIPHRTDVPLAGGSVSRRNGFTTCSTPCDALERNGSPSTASATCEPRCSTSSVSSNASTPCYNAAPAQRQCDHDQEVPDCSESPGSPISGSHTCRQRRPAPVPSRRLRLKRAITGAQDRGSAHEQQLRPIRHYLRGSRSRRIRTEPKLV